MGNRPEILKNSIVHVLLVWINDIYDRVDWVSTDGIIMDKKHLFNHGTCMYPPKNFYK